MNQPVDVVQSAAGQAPAVWVGKVERALSLAGIRGVELARFAAVVSQLGLLFAALYLFRIEEQFGLVRILPLIFFGFIVHAALPLRYRLPFVVLLSWSAIGFLFGVVQGAGLILLGLVLIGICHLPLAFRVRIALLLAAGATLVVLRAEWIKTSWTQLPTLILPILGSMFMFRLIIYLYDMRHEKKPASLWERLSYFFLLPNVCFPLFPVVDYQTYRRTYYDSASHEIYQKGMLWILRGTVHLLLYRVVYYYFVLTPTEVQGLGGVVQSVISIYLLYLRISGQFHLIIGLLCLFGFNLPETHRLYFLASSFNDYWRRINIYWKDFMMKIFYYPTLMRARRWGMNTGMVVATVVVFAGTWLLHSYQWFWLRGTFPLTATDALFWGILGGLVVLNSLYEAKRGRNRSLGETVWSLRDAALHSAKTVGMLVLISLLWSLWSSPSVGEWVSLLSTAAESGARDFALLLLALVLLIGVGILLQYAAARGWRLSLVGSHPPFARSAAFTGSVALLLVLAGLPRVHTAFGAEAAAVISSLQESKLNRHDEEQLERGYYEGLLEANNYTTALWTVNARRPQDWAIGTREADAVRKRADMLEYELIPSYHGVFKQEEFRVNQWGMRDREYSQATPPHTFRMALLGASYQLGAGVKGDETFDNVLEDKLNEEPLGEELASYEILNFSVGGYSVLHNVIVAEQRAFAFDPDLLLFTIHSTEERRLTTHLTNLVQAGTDIPYPALQQMIRSTGVSAEMEKSEISRRLQPILYGVIGWGLQRIADTCHQHGAMCVAVYVPTTEETRGVDPERFARLTGLARQAGFAIISLDGAFAGVDEASIQLAPWDKHPNATGHRLLADRLYEAFRDESAALLLNSSRKAGSHR